MGLSSSLGKVAYQPLRFRRISPEDSGVKMSVTVRAIQTEVEDCEPVTRMINQFSSWIHLIRMICWLFRVKDLLLCLTAKAIFGKENSEY